MTEQKPSRKQLATKGCRMPNSAKVPTRSSARLAGVSATFPDGLDSDADLSASAAQHDYSKARDVLKRLDADLKVAITMCGPEFEFHLNQLVRRGRYVIGRNVVWEVAFWGHGDGSVASAKRTLYVRAIYDALKTHCTALIANQVCNCAFLDWHDDDGHCDTKLAHWIDMEDSDDDEPM
jgi:hypothetical protein